MVFLQASQDDSDIPSPSVISCLKELNTQLGLVQWQMGGMVQPRMKLAQLQVVPNTERDKEDPWRRPGRDEEVEAGDDTAEVVAMPSPFLIPFRLNA